MSAGKVRQGGVFVEIGADAKKFFATLSRVNKQIGQVGKQMAMMGAKLTAAGAAITAPLAGAAAAFASVGDAVQKMAARTGLSTEAVSGLAFAAEQGGADMATLEKGIRTMQRSLDDAATKGGEAAEAFQRLGIDINQLSQMSPEQQFMALADALAGVEDPGQRAALAMRIFGRAGTQLLPMMEGGAAGIAELRAEAERLGIVMDKDTADSAAALTDAMNAMGNAFRAIVVNVGGAVAPIFTKIARVVSMLAGDFSRFAKENGRFIQIALAVGAAIAGLGVTLTTAGFAVMGLSASFGALGGIMAAIASPIALVVGGLAAVVAFGPQIASALTAAFGNTGALIGQAANTIAGPLRVAMQDAAIVMADLGQTATTTFQGISDAITAGNLSGAMDMLMAGLVAGWLRGSEALMSYIDPWLAFFQNTFTYAGTFIATKWEEMWSGLTQGSRTFGAVLQGAFDNVINGILAAWDTMEAAVRKSWNWVQSWIKKGYNLAEKNNKVDSEMSARAADRQAARPGVASRMADAAAANAVTAAETQQRMDAMNANANATAQGRYDQNDQRARERREATLAAEARVGELAAQFAEEAAAVAAEQERATASALDLGDVAATASKAEVVGTFSGGALGQLGFGSSLAQQQLETQKKIEQNTRNLGPAVVGA